MEKRIEYADDDISPISKLLKLRVPSLMIGLLLGIGLSFVTSNFEDVLEKNVAVSFFIPFIVYLADAVGTQTQSIYARDLKTGNASFRKYLIKETLLGIMLGLIFSMLTAPIILFWFKSKELMLAVCLSLFGAIATSPIIALTITEILQVERTDPAVGAGPIATVIQDTISVLIYGLIASAILL
ncbi:MAG: magnesium transporter [Nanoarchaeota archaeon]